MVRVATTSEFSLSRDAGALLRAGIDDVRAERTSSAKLLLGAAASLYKDAGDPWNASVARQWLNALQTPKP